MQIHIESHLRKLNTKRLIALLKAVRRHVRILLNVYCRCCDQFLGKEEELEKIYDEARPYEKYADQIKEILKTHEHVVK